jgi:transcriptional regulator with XRE-family HTH domain
LEERVSDHGSPTVRRRRLAAELHRLRERSGLTGDQVAERLGWSPSKISRIENTRSGLKLADARKLLDLYEVSDRHREELLALAREADRKAWWEAYSDALPSAYAFYIALEAEARLSWEREVQIVPGLLQTEDYARAVIRRHVDSTAIITPGDIERRVEVRMARQKILMKEGPLELAVILDESVLTRRIGDDGVMRAQLKQLLERSDLPNVTLQAHPLERPQAIGTDSFVLLRFNPAHETSLHDVVYLETLNGGIYIERESETYQYRLAFERMMAEALDPRQTQDLISKAIRDI